MTGSKSYCLLPFVLWTQCCAGKNWLTIRGLVSGQGLLQTCRGDESGAQRGFEESSFSGGDLTLPLWIISPKYIQSLHLSRVSDISPQSDIQQHGKALLSCRVHQMLFTRAFPLHSWKTEDCILWPVGLSSVLSIIFSSCSLVLEDADETGERRNMWEVEAVGQGPRGRPGGRQWE